MMHAMDWMDLQYLAVVESTSCGRQDAYLNSMEFCRLKNHLLVNHSMIQVPALQYFLVVEPKNKSKLKTKRK